MSIFKSVINVNNGNTGWNNGHVLDALETAFSQLGWNGGSSVAGSPVYINAPGYGIDVGNTNYRFCGGTTPAQTSAINRYFYVTNNGTSSYSVLEEWGPSGIDLTNDTVTLNRHSLQTGDPIVWSAYTPGATSTITGLTVDTGYFVIKVNSNTIKFAATAQDASNGTAVNLTATSTGWNTSISIRRAFNVLYNNYQIDAVLGDTLTFFVNDSGGTGRFFLINSPSTGYAANTVLNTTNSGNAPTMPTGHGTDLINWVTQNWPQTETQASNIQEVSGTGYPGVVSYGYGNSVNPAMRGVINLYPVAYHSTPTNQIPYWKYEVPASGGRSSLKLRIYRRPNSYYESYRGNISGISINSIGSGWSNNEVFTIPGSAVGGVDGTNDILVGVNSSTTAQQTAQNGVCSLAVTNYGSGSTMYQKSPTGLFAVLKNVNDSNKIFGTTFYGFGMDSNNYRMYIKSGCAWNTLNQYGTTATGSSGYGLFGGDMGLDYQQYYNEIPTSGGNSTYIDYATTSTPTAYPLSIRIYKAQSPQDTNFAVIQFTQTINNTIFPYATFSIQKGPGFGSSVWDLNHVWNGGITQYGGSGRSISIVNRVPSWNYYYQPSNAEVSTNYTLSREANYGYSRNGGGYSSSGDQLSINYYACNIDTGNDLQNSTEIVTYYRNSTYDKLGSKSVSASANYYKPIKGIPIANNLMPCPYYLPDDYIMLQVATSPGLTQFRPGDTITISSSEIYEIILAGYQTSQNGLDNIASNNSIGMLFCARTT